jgi:cell division protein FtsI (penicillin-binding protein 3)
VTPATRPRAHRPRRPDPRRRVALLLGVFTLVGLGLFAVLVELQAVRPDRYRALQERQLLRTVPIDGYRGSVLDRSGFVLAMSTRAHRVVVDPTMIEDPHATAAVLAPHLGRDPAQLGALLADDGSGRRYELVARGIDDEVAARLEGLRDTERGLMIGVFVVPDEQRVHPAGRLAANLVGHTDPDLRGVSGIEAMFDDTMTGADGSETFEGGRYGRISVGERVLRPASAGADVVLTIDHRLQYVVDQALIDHCEAVEANGASAAISDPRSGELLALSSVVRNASGACVVPGANRALVDTFEPGSVLKLVTMAAAVEQLGLTATTEVPVTASVGVADKVFRDFYPLVPADYPLWQVLAASSNVGTIRVAQQLGPDTLHGYLSAFGFGAPTGIGFQGESAGSLRPVSDWWGADIGSIAIGQGVTVNIVQLLAALNVVANDGVYVAPSLVRSVVDGHGREHQTAQATRRVISEATADEVTTMLTRAVSDGTGSAAAVTDYEVAGKTGTAWKAVRLADGSMSYLDDDRRRRYVVTFAGFVPADEPELSMVVVVDEPRTETSASTVAAPVFSRITQYALRILGIPPTDAVVRDDGTLVRGTPADEPTGPLEAELAGPEGDPAPGTP